MDYHTSNLHNMGSRLRQDTLGDKSSLRQQFQSDSDPMGLGDLSSSVETGLGPVSNLVLCSKATRFR